MRRRVKKHLPEPSAACGPVKECSAEDEKKKKNQSIGIVIGIVAIGLLGLKMYLANVDPKEDKKK